MRWFVILGCLFVNSCQTHHERLLNNDYERFDRAPPFYNLYGSIVREHSYDALNDAHFQGPRRDFAQQTNAFDPSDYQVDIDKNTFDKPNKADASIVWLGHASYVITLSTGLRVAIDPMLTDLPFHSWFDTLKRISDPIITPSALPNLDAVVISHNHYDHLDFETLDKLSKETAFLLPLGVESTFSSSYKNVIGMDWFTSKTYGDTKITFLPAHHWSKRTLFDTNETNWGAWMIEHNNKKIFFAGDTGYSKHFELIRQKVGPIDICLMPICSYRPHHYREHHMTPEDSLDAAETLGCKTVIPWGYATFLLGETHALEPMHRLKYGYAQKDYSFELVTPKMGEKWLVH